LTDSRGSDEFVKLRFWYSKLACGVRQEGAACAFH